MPLSSDVELDTGEEPEGKRGLTPDEIKEALRLASVGIASDKRKREAWDRWAILSESHERLVLERIDRTHCDLDTKKQLARWVDVSQNVALDIADEVCVVWDKPATRTLGKPPEPAEPPEPEPAAAGAPPFGEAPAPAAAPAKKPPPFGKKPAAAAAAEDEPANGPPGLPALPKKPAKPKAKDNDETIALRTLYAELEVDSWLQDLNKAAWLLTEAVVVLSVVGGKMRSQILLPFFYDVIDDPDDPGGEPLAYVYRLRRDDNLFDAIDPGEAYTDRQGDIVILDAKGWHIYAHGAAGPESPHKTLPHDLGYMPAVPLRFSRPLNGERWGDYRKHRRLIDSTIAVSLITTQLQFVRKAQNKFLLLAIGNLGEGDDGEVSDPERGRAIATNSPGQLDVKALPFDTSPDNCIKHISYIYGNAARAYGGQTSESMGEGGSVSPSVTFSHAAQTELRVEQVPYARRFELKFAEVACAMAKAANHEVAADLPEAEEIRETFSVRFAPLSRVYANPSDEQTHFDFLKANGVASPYDLARREDPDLTLEQARDHVMARLEETAEVNAFAAERNMPMDGTGVQSVPEALGKLGPVAKGLNPEEPAADAPAKEEP